MLKDIITLRIKNQKGSIIYTYTFVKWSGQFLKTKTKTEIKIQIVPYAWQKVKS